MNRTELNELVKQTCVAFPGMQELVEKHSNTVSVWGQTLVDVPLQDALAVLKRWIAGTLENPPIGFRREMFALDVKAVVGRVHADWFRKKQNQEMIDKANRKKHRSAAFIAVAPAFEKFLAYNDQVINGTLTQEERDLQVKNDIQELFPIESNNEYSKGF